EIPAALGEGRARRHGECHRQSETKGQHELSHCGSPSCPAEPCVGLAVACARAITSRLTWGSPRTAFLACAGSCSAHVRSGVPVYANSLSFAQAPLHVSQRSPGQNIAADLYRNVLFPPSVATKSSAHEGHHDGDLRFHRASWRRTCGRTVALAH